MAESAVEFSRADLSKAAGESQIIMRLKNYIKKIKECNFGFTLSFEKCRK